MSIFEIAMLLFFGSAWPFAISKSWKARSNSGKSIAFLFVVFMGYIAGILHKVFFDFDAVIFFYFLNTLFVITDIAVYIRNMKFK